LLNDFSAVLRESQPPLENACHVTATSARQALFGFSGFSQVFGALDAPTDNLTVHIDLTQKPQSKSEMHYFPTSLNCIAPNYDFSDEKKKIRLDFFLSYGHLVSPPKKSQSDRIMTTTQF
jgi:hypothetical protein